MKAVKYSIALMGALLLTGCASLGPRHGNGLPYDNWYLGFQAPPRMEVWLETANIEDTQGRFFPGAMSGTVSLAYRADPAGWDEPSIGAGRYIENMGLPRRIYVRWQSLVEPQTYRAIIEIPEAVRQRMLVKPVGRVRPGVGYPRFLSIGLAPGGWIRVWILGSSVKTTEVLCTRGEIEPKGPDLGEYGGRYVTLNPAVKTYLQSHPIPYDSWACPNVNRAPTHENH